MHRLLASPCTLRFLRSKAPAACGRAHIHHDNARSWQKWQRWRGKVRQSLQDDAPKPSAAEPKDVLGEKDVDNDARWAGSLARRERYHGQRGTMAIWNLRRHAASPLPTDDGPHAEFLWGTFVKHPALVTQVIDHAAHVLESTGKVHPRLYELLMSHWLPRDAARALAYHHLMLEKLQLKALPLKTLARQGAATFKPAAYDALMEIYWASNERDLYDEIVPVMADRGDVAMARRWHTLCLHRGDMPSEAVAAYPIVHIFTAESAAANGAEPVSRETARKDRTYNKDLMRRLLGRETPPVRFDDDFTARMFATRTFPPESVIKGLAMVGVNEIGPQAVLAMARRTEALEELPGLFDELKATGIALQGCVYSLALEKFAMAHNWQLVRSMLDTDQHPNVFGDVKMQRSLLDFYLDQQDNVQVQRTLAILTLFHNDSAQESWNLLLQTHIRRTGPQHVTQVLQYMRVRGVVVTPESIAAIKTLLRRRQRGRRPVTLNRGFDDLRFVTRVYTTILEFGMGTVSPLTWREIIRRFGMTGRFKELRRLLLWLLCWYAPRSSIQFSHLPESPLRQPALKKLRKLFPERDHYFHFPGTVTQHENPLHPIRRLFPPPLQQALVIWGFRAGLLPHANLEQSLFGSTLAKKHYRARLLRAQILQRKRWSIGLRTLVLLRDLGVYVHRHTVVKALQMQFTVLFGRGRSNKLDNRVMEETNSIPYATYVREVNAIWGTPLLREPRLFHGGMVHEHLWHPRMRRRVHRRGEVSVREILGGGWQAEQADGVKVGGPEDDAAYRNIKRVFEAQEVAPEPGFEWMYERSLDTGGGERKGGG